MPDKAPNAEERAKRYSVYLRPWVLDRDDACPAVPHITHLRADYKRSTCARAEVRSSSDPIPSARRLLNKKPKVVVEGACVVLIDLMQLYLKRGFLFKMSLK